MTDRPDPDRTRDIHLPPEPGPTRQFRTPPPPGPTRQISTPPQRTPVRPASQPPAGASEEPPWWQTINKDRKNPVPQQPVEFPPSYPHSPTRQPPPPSPNTPTEPPASHGSRRLLIGGSAAAAVLVIAVGIVIGTGLSTQTDATGKLLDIRKAQQGVAEVLLDPVSGYGVKSLGSVSCNNGVDPLIRKGDSFACDVVVDGAGRRVTVVFQDDDGTYAVDRPR